MAIQKILIAVDDSRYADHAAEVGFEMARFCNAEVGLVNIIEPLILPSSGSDSITGITTDVSMVNESEMVRIQKEAAENTVRRIQEKYAERLKITNFTEYGLTADGILKCGAEFGADLIVVGTHSRTGIDRLFMGSIAEHVVRHSKVPVLVVPLRESESQ
ncbi:universal stress protein [Mucilaginibacter sp. BT774]|uniref:universal stress protein n=1 Tax=Mucilaginibacter sp. BT774 TaxID=3062276 RepID=UPI002676C008|nr:universal stress protein [Mucilaginibacter sp. BT774]MDO3626880.1 universal stress protein [Mucilaginibacter sp. BT774]